MTGRDHSFQAACQNLLVYGFVVRKVINVVGAVTVQHVLIDHDTVLPINKTTFLLVN